MMIRKVLTLMLFPFFIGNVMGQISEVNLKDLDVEYVEVITSRGFLKKKMTMKLDYGQENKGNADGYVIGKNKEILEFNSEIDALNFMYSHGYELVAAFPDITKGDSSARYIMRKRKE
ncbi:MAG: hypothetical protein LC107_01465 [Chitinophagales bacterium]|nr:hypothetical protein [Chitinophagales bacterium]